MNRFRPKKWMTLSLNPPSIDYWSNFQQFVDSVSLFRLFIYKMRSNKFVP